MPRLPQPPFGKNVDDLHRSLTDVINFMRQNYDNGSKHPGFSQDSIDAKTDQSFLGTILLNETSGESNISYRDMNGDIKWRPVGRTTP